VTTAKLYHNTVMLNFNTGEEILNVKAEELDECGIAQFIPTGDAVVDHKAQLQYEEALKANRDRLSKYTLSNALNQLFDVIEMPNNSDFALYADVLKNVRIAREQNLDSVEISKEELEKLKKIFSKPPKQSQNNRIVAFVLECINKSIAESLI